MLELPHTRFSSVIDKGIRKFESLFSWVWLVLLIVIVVNVVLRYFFSQGRIELEELQWHLYSIGFLLAIPYALVTDSHIRVDVLRSRLQPQTQTWIELYGLIFLLLPFILLILVNSVPFIHYSYTTAEISEAPGGLPYRWLIKSVLLIAFSLLLVAVAARLSRVWCYLFGFPALLIENSQEDRNHVDR